MLRIFQPGVESYHIPARIHVLEWCTHIAYDRQYEAFRAMDASEGRLRMARREVSQRWKDYRDLRDQMDEDMRCIRSPTEKQRTSRRAAYREKAARLVQVEEAIATAAAEESNAEAQWLADRERHRIAASRVVALLDIARLINRMELSALVEGRRASL